MRKQLFNTICWILLFNPVGIIAQCPETNPNCFQTSNWIFCDSLHFQFLKAGIQVKTYPINLNEATSTFSNSSKELLLCLKPNGIYNKSGALISSIFGGNSSRQGALIIQHPSSLQTIHLITSDEGESKGIKKLYSHELNASFNINYKNKVKLINAVEGLGCTNHLNQNDIWIATHNRTSDTFALFLIKPSGWLCCPSIIKQGGNYCQSQLSPSLNGTQIRFSPNGEYLLGGGSESNLGGYERIDLFNFNAESGILSENVLISFVLMYGAAFSPNSKVLYLNNTQIYQFDLNQFNANAINNSKKLLTPDWNRSLNYLQISPYGTIYSNYYDSSFIGQILYPNKLGLACGYNIKYLETTPRKIKHMQPNFNASYFYTPSIDFAYTEDCWQHKYQFEGRDTLKANAWKWVFAKGSYRDSILTKHCAYQFPDTGKWQVSHVATNGARTETVTKTLTIRPKWQKDVLGKDTFYCARRSPSEGEPPFKLVLRSPTNMHCVHWMGEEPNLDETLGPIVDYNHFHVDSMVVDTAGTYIVKLTNKTFCQMWDTFRIVEGQIPAKPEISYLSKELASTVKAAKYRWFLNDTLLFETENKSFIPTKNGYYRVQLISAQKCESPRSENFLVDKLGLEMLEKLSFKVYPNPSDGNITIDFGQIISGELAVYDVTGKLVASKHIRNRQSIDLLLKTSGNYVLKVETTDGLVGQQVVRVE